MKALTVPSTNHSRRTVGQLQAVSIACSAQPGKKLTLRECLTSAIVTCTHHLISPYLTIWILNCEYKASTMPPFLVVVFDFGSRVCLLHYMDQWGKLSSQSLFFAWRYWHGTVFSLSHTENKSDSNKRKIKSYNGGPVTSSLRTQLDWVCETISLHLVIPKPMEKKKKKNVIKRDLNRG